MSDTDALVMGRERRGRGPVHISQIEDHCYDPTLIKFLNIIDSWFIAAVLAGLMRGEGFGGGSTIL
jgi:hypothetical protein